MLFSMFLTIAVDTSTSWWYLAPSENKLDRCTILRLINADFVSNTSPVTAQAVSSNIKMLSTNASRLVHEHARCTLTSMTSTLGDSVAFPLLLLLYMWAEPRDYHQYKLKTNKGCGRGNRRLRSGSITLWFMDHWSIAGRVSELVSVHSSNLIANSPASQ